ncbi:MerR family transcriptional regulator [Pseudomonas leptonychotis]|uniref:MerR family transcriptional regulator n=1 Tax=Pseudomonas leptonychotis TaxID=2448482 RepID=A0A4T2A415_9PSED|nr:MerR family transcriptional regulator [Pseudomonas leptonychotis]TIH10558.1 MerR family transcriptional regulator [Pseudomonas leptonychotis]
MKIGQLAERSGLPPSRIRFYEARGLLSAQRQANGYRRYPEQALQTLSIISCAQQAGFSLEEIRRLLPQADTTGLDHAELLTSLQRKVSEIELMQQRLVQNKAQLLTIIATIENKPAGMLCTENAERVLATLRNANNG